METTRLARRLKAARAAQGLTLRQVEIASGNRISHNYLCQVEKGSRTDINPRKLRAIAPILHLDYVELLILAEYITVKELLRAGARSK